MMCIGSILAKQDRDDFAFCIERRIPNMSRSRRLAAAVKVNWAPSSQISRASIHDSDHTVSHNHRSVHWRCTLHNRKYLHRTLARTYCSCHWNHLRDDPRSVRHSRPERPNADFRRPKGAPYCHLIRPQCSAYRSNNHRHCRGRSFDFPGGYVLRCTPIARDLTPSRRFR